MGLPVENAVALGLDHSVADRLSQMALAGARGPEEERVFVAVDELTGCQLEDELSIHLSVEVKVKGIEPLVPVAEFGLLHPSGDEAITAAGQLVGNQHRGEGRGSSSFPSGPGASAFPETRRFRPVASY